MNNSIKEILDKLKIKNDRYSHHLKYNISYENKDEDYEAHLLLNYITNLQKENNQHISDIQVLMNKKENLERLTKKLQQELDQYKNNWEELKKMFEADEHFEDGCYCGEILNKMKELEENN